MKKRAARKASAKKVGDPRFAKRVAVKQARTAGTPRSTNLHSDGTLTFNHAMIYVKDVDRALHFYYDLLGFKLIEDFRHEGTPVYARRKHHVAMAPSLCIKQVQAIPFLAMACACTSKSAISMNSAKNSSRKAFSSQNCPAWCPGVGGTPI
jgi:hypothetical protein